MTGITPGNHLVIEALIQHIYYLHFAGSGLTSSFLVTKGKKDFAKPFLSCGVCFFDFAQDL